LIADSTGATVWRHDNTEPFADSVPDENPSGLGAFEFPLRFPGQYADKETNLAYNMARDYASETGRYVQSDPIGLRGGVNTYLYAAADPLRFDDPFGLRARVCCRLIPWMQFTLARHCYIERDTGGTRTTWGLIGNSGGPFSTYGNVYRNNDFDSGGGCGDWNEDCAADGCVERAASGYPNPSVYRFARGPKSNTFAGTVARACNLARPDVLSTPGWDDQPAQQKPGTTKQPVANLGSP